MKKNLLLAFTFMSLFLMAGALAESFTFKQQEDVNFRFRCFDDDGGYCPASVGCQISTEAPNGTNVLNNRTMTFNETFFNVSLVTQDLGTYDSIIVCQGSNSTSSEFTYLVTSTGNPLDTQQSILIFGLLIALLFLSGAFLTFGIKTEIIPVKLFLITMGALFMVVIIGISINTISQLLLVESVYANIFLGVFILLTALISVGFMGLMLYIITVSVKAFKKSRGFSDDDDDF